METVDYKFFLGIKTIHFAWNNSRKISRPGINVTIAKIVFACVPLTIAAGVPPDPPDKMMTEDL